MVLCRQDRLKKNLAKILQIKSVDLQRIKKFFFFSRFQYNEFNKSSYHEFAPSSLFLIDLKIAEWLI